MLLHMRRISVALKDQIHARLAERAAASVRSVSAEAAALITESLNRHDLESGKDFAADDPAAWDTLLQQVFVPYFRAGEGVGTYSVSQGERGRVVRFTLPRTGNITINTIRYMLPRVEVGIRCKPGAIRAELGDHAGDIVLTINEGPAQGGPAARPHWNSPAWLSGQPPRSGYYLGAWQRGNGWMVSELWFNETTGWWPSRGYFGESSSGVKPMTVEAWMPVPIYEPGENVAAAQLGESRSEPARAGGSGYHGDPKRIPMIWSARLFTYPGTTSPAVRARPGETVRWDDLPACTSATVHFLDLAGCAVMFFDAGPVAAGQSLTCKVPDKTGVTS